MNILIADDEQIAVDSLKATVSDIFGESAQIRTTTSPERALRLVKEAEEPFNIAFLDIEMPKMSGLELAVKIKNESPKTDIIMVTAYPEYTLDALRIHVSDYLLKPAGEEEVRRALDNLEHQPEEETPSEKLKVTCFGSFEVFYGGKPVAFRRKRTKEIFAYLVDRKGAACTMGELMGIIYEDDNSASRRSWMRTLLHDLRTTFESLGMPDVIIKGWNTVAVNCERLDCDYYKLTDGNPKALNDYRGEYMSQYSWAEMSFYH